MSFLHALRTRWHEKRIESERQAFLKAIEGDAVDLRREDWDTSLAQPTEFYARCFQYFHILLPETLRQHRLYFEQDGRGFGERAFHVMWYLLFREFRPSSFLEIGVYRGQTVTLAALLARELGLAVDVYGISPFSAVGDAVSTYRADVDYYEDTLKNFRHFGLAPTELLRAFSTDPEAIRKIASRSWDFVYIDGCHDYEVAIQDWQHAAASVHRGSVVVLDDAGLTTSYVPRPLIGFGGHPGPSRLAQEIDRSEFREILQVGHNRVFQRL